MKWIGACLGLACMVPGVSGLRAGPDNGDFLGLHWEAPGGQAFGLQFCACIDSEGAVEHSSESHPAPANNRAINARLLKIGGESPYDLASATYEEEKPYVWRGRSAWTRSVWWRYGASPADGVFLLEADPAPTGLGIAVWRDNAADGEEPLAAAYAGAISAPVHAGEPGKIALLFLDGAGRHAGRGVMRVRFLPVGTGNDAMADAIDLGSGWMAGAYGNPTEATLEEGEPDHPGTGTGSLWWKWTAPADCLVRVFTSIVPNFPGYNRRFPVYRGKIPGKLTTYVPGSLAHEGETLWLALTGGGYVGAAPMMFELRALPAPGNDAFADAIDIGTAAEWEQRFLFGGATLEEGETHSSGGGSLWWKWTAPKDGDLEIESTQWSGPRARMYVFRGSELSGLKEVAELSGWTPRKLAVKSGEPLRIVVVGNDGADVKLKLKFSGMVPGDRFGAPLDLGRRESFLLATPTDAVAEEIDKVRFPDAGQTVWWIWRAPGNGVLKFFPPIPGWHLFRDGANPGALEEVDDGRVKAGVRYRIAYAGSGHDYETRWHFQADPKKGALPGATGK